MASAQGRALAAQMSRFREGAPGPGGALAASLVDVISDPPPSLVLALEPRGLLGAKEAAAPSISSRISREGAWCPQFPHFPLLVKVYVCGGEGVPATVSTHPSPPVKGPKPGASSPSFASRCSLGSGPWACGSFHFLFYRREGVWCSPPPPLHVLLRAVVWGVCLPPVRIPHP